MDRDTAQTWLDDYVAAWKSYDRDAIAALFARDVAYRYHPYDEPLVGRDAVVDSWLGENDADGASTRDAPDTYDAHYMPYAVDGDTLVATGTSVYQDHPDGPVTHTFDNCFLIRFDDEGRCVEFTEVYMERPGPA
ncbi:nuclear transport factor 2 family protein [Nocardioides islandensis]|uniref:Nuclear transport factor 2 family protein n=1 Tax=Nocardioides islandensis TaxID=433663 RepID=A0A930VFX8_9ACTN|nr:nuclear transport factor 2 family protein [Nocardioides islandensis]MBF4765857.1 nuclear transport factor 2 family protein [Nocardioides islandensis]